MSKPKLLILTDHKNHSAENALYAFARTAVKTGYFEHVDVATRNNVANRIFFEEHKDSLLHISRVTETFSFTPEGLFLEPTATATIDKYDAVWLRLPPPLSKTFLDFLKKEYPDQLFINDPAGIWKTGSKEFLLNFPELCAPMKACFSVKDVVAYKNQFPIVLKPFREYGGRGIVRIEGEQVWEGKTEKTFDQFVNSLTDRPVEYLAVKFLKNVDQGDKRIVVLNGKIMGASLRLPAKDSWLCNVAMGGSSNYTEVDDTEIAIVKELNPALSKMGILMYGVDTLMGDQGKRVLSEINTTSIGGLPQIAKLLDRPLVEEAIQIIYDYIYNRIHISK